MAERNAASQASRQQFINEGFKTDGIKQPDRIKPNGFKQNGFKRNDTNSIDLYEFSNRLHDALDFYQLFDTFIDELRAAVACDSVEYEHTGTKTTLVNGVTGMHRCSYSLKYEEQTLGDICITRDSKFLDTELETIEIYLAGLSLPLRNALRYLQAVRFAQRDKLTGLRSGKYYHDIVELEIERAQRYKKPFSLLMFKVDDLVDINKQFGRGAGDAILAGVALRIEHEARRSDIVYRKGGDEFLVFLPGTEKDVAILAAKRIKDYVMADVIAYEDKAIDFTLSAGVVTVSHGDTASNLINRADRALYHAKVLGKDRIYAEPDPAVEQTGIAQ